MFLSGARRTRLAILGGSVLLVCYAWVLFGHVAAAVGGPDSAGPFGAARMITSRTAALRLPLVERFGLDENDSWVFAPAGFVPGMRAGTAVPLHSPGFALHVAAVALLLGWTAAPFFISPVAALLCLELVYVIARELKLSRVAAVTATTVVAACPLFVVQAIQPENGVVATLWCLASVAAALATRRGSPAWGFGAGLALGIAVLVRPATLAILPAVLVALRWKRSTVALFVLGVLPPVMVLGLYDRAVYGGWIRTGHAIAGLHPRLEAGLSSFFQQIAANSRWLARTMTPLLLIGSVAAIADRRIARRDRILLLLWWVGFLVFESIRKPSEMGQWLHYALPGIPAMVIGSLIAWRDFIAHPLEAAKRKMIAPALSVAAVALVLAIETRAIVSGGILASGRRQNVYPDAARWAQRYVPDEGLVLSREFNGALFFYSDRVPVRWEALDPARFERIRKRADAFGYRWYALLAPAEIDGARRAAPGGWRELSRVPNSDVTLWAID